MQKQVEIEIKEDIDYLKKLRKNENNHQLKTRIQSLIFTKENKFTRCLDLANHLGIGIASLDRWTRGYKESGLESMLTISNGGKRRNSVPKEVHEGLAKKIYDSNNPFLGYWDAALWVTENYRIEVKITPSKKEALKTPQRGIKNQITSVVLLLSFLLFLDVAHIYLSFIHPIQLY